MIIRTTKKIPTGLKDIKADKDKFIFRHVENIDGALTKAHLLRTYSNNGWTEKKHFRQIGCIPTAEFVRHPEWIHEPSLIVRWLKSEEGRPYRTVSKGL